MSLLSPALIHLMKALNAESLWYMIESVSVLQVEKPVGMAHSFPKPGYAGIHQFCPALPTDFGKNNMRDFSRFCLYFIVLGISVYNWCWSEIPIDTNCVIVLCALWQIIKPLISV